jgi:hypothetical protein
MAKTKQPLVPRICDVCYNNLSKAVTNAGIHNMVAAHCPHYETLIEVTLVEGIPLCVAVISPVTEEEANEKINEAFAFDPNEYASQQ